MSLYEQVRPVLFSIDPEDAHQLITTCGNAACEFPSMQRLLEKYYRIHNPSLQVRIKNLLFQNPIGLAAGFDKNAEHIRLAKTLGFGFTEIGSVSKERRKGNQKPRLFRLKEDKSLINRMGLNNKGVDRILKNVDKEKKFPIAINIVKTHDPTITGKEAIKDIAYTFKRAQEKADFIVINLSCPNTREGKTFESGAALVKLLKAIEFNNTIPTFLKCSPHLKENVLKKIIAATEEFPIDGFVFSNTSRKREGLRANKDWLSNIGQGGLSGPALAKATAHNLKIAYRATNGKKTLIGVGGVQSAEDAYTLIKSGASLVQVYTGLIYKGPSLIKEINEGLLKRLKEDGYETIQEAVGRET